MCIECIVLSDSLHYDVVSMPSNHVYTITEETFTTSAPREFAFIQSIYTCCLVQGDKTSNPIPHHTHALNTVKRYYTTSIQTSKEILYLLFLVLTCL